MDNQTFKIETMRKKRPEEDIIDSFGYWVSIILSLGLMFFVYKGAYDHGSSTKLDLLTIAAALVSTAVIGALIILIVHLTSILL